MINRVYLGIALGLSVLATLLPCPSAFIRPIGVVPSARTHARSRGAVFAKDPYHPQNTKGPNEPPGVGGPQASPEYEKLNEVTDTVLTKKQKEELLEDEYTSEVKADTPADAHTSSEAYEKDPNPVGGTGGKDANQSSGAKGAWRCTVCGFIYDETTEGKAFKSEPEAYQCPRCGAGKGDFEDASGDSQ